MRLNAKWNRRGFLGSVGVLTGLLVAPRKAFSWASKSEVKGFGSSGNPYEELGVTTVINSRHDDSSRGIGLASGVGSRHGASGATFCQASGT